MSKWQVYVLQLWTTPMQWAWVDCTPEFAASFPYAGRVRLV